MSKVSTKDEERVALKKIEKIVKDLGEDSYLATAFEGCFQIAGSNIEYDMADSLAGRIELLEKNVDYFKDLAETLSSENSNLVSRCVIFQTKLLDQDDAAYVFRTILQKLDSLNSDIVSTEKAIVDSADDPTSGTFRDNVRMHRALISEKADCIRVKERFEKIITPNDDI